MPEKLLNKFWTGIALLGILNLIWFNASILLTSDTLQVQYIPDDAYYYLSLARNFVHLHMWTFDSGISLTTGFHPLWAYLLAFFYAILKPDSDGFVQICILLSVCFSLLSALIIFWKGLKLQQPMMLAVLAVLLGTRNILLNSVSGVEWSLTGFIILLFCLTMVDGTSELARYSSLFILGALGSMARMDFGLLPLAFVAAGLVVWILRSNRLFFVSSMCGLAGAVVGAVLVFLHNFWMTGQALQSSALMKNHWMAGTLNPTPLLISGLGLTALLLFPVLGGKIRNIPLSDTQVVLGIAGIFAWIGYGIFYSKNSDIQPWYSVNILFSVFTFLSAVWYFTQYGWLKKYAYLPHILFLAVVAGQYVYNVLAIYPLSDVKSQWPHQQAFLTAGKYLSDHRPAFDNGRIGAWNAGIINYYQGGEVVNLDGLVNNDIYFYAVSNSSYEYLEDRNIRYVLDLDVMFKEHILERSGYNDPRFTNSLLPIMVFNEEAFPNIGFLKLYELKDSK